MAAKPDHLMCLLQNINGFSDGILPRPCPGCYVTYDVCTVYFLPKPLNGLPAEDYRGPRFLVMGVWAPIVSNLFYPLQSVSTTWSAGIHGIRAEGKCKGFASETAGASPI